MATLNIGCGANPIQGATNLDRVKHSPWVDVAHDLNTLPWPFEDRAFDRVIAQDVMEHTKLEIWEWLGECHRILRPGGELLLHLPAWNCELSWRDPTHNRVFHPQTFDYWQPGTELHKFFGRFYPGSEQERWWTVEKVWFDDERPARKRIEEYLPGVDEAVTVTFLNLIAALGLDRYVYRGDIGYLLVKL